MNKVFMFCAIFAASLSFSQGVDTQTRDNASAFGVGIKSGFYETLNPLNYPVNASGWWHLLDVRHSNPANNYAMQFSGGFESQDLYFRKTANAANTAWSRILMESPSGNVRIGQNDDAASTASLRIFKSDLPFIELANSIGRFQIMKVNCSDCAAVGARSGDVVMRSLGESNNIVLNITNNNNDGNSYIGFSDAKNGLWAKILNNRTARFDGKVFAREVEVKANVWADFVFEKDYQLPTLEEVERHVIEKGHLENIPSAEQALRDGVNVGDFQVKLLQKIEELTLYAIEQNKLLKEQAEKIKKLEDRAAATKQTP